MNCSSVGVALIFMGCGGQVVGNPLGSLDDAGVFRAPDGAIQFGPGSACPGYDPNNFAHATVGPCTTSVDCIAPITNSAPPNYPFVRNVDCPPPAICAEAQLSSNQSSASDRIACTVGTDGDKYCAAFYGQFVVGNGQVEVTCQGVCRFSDGPNGTKICNPDAQSGACTPSACSKAPNSALALMVVRGDAGPICEAPCAAP